MKKRHIGKVNIFPSKKKEMIKFLNDPKALEKLEKLGNLASKMSKTQESLSTRKYDSLEEWLAFSLTNMSNLLFEKTKQNGFQEKMNNLVLNYLSLEETNNERTTNC